MCRCGSQATPWEVAMQPHSLCTCWPKGSLPTSFQQVTTTEPVLLCLWRCMGMHHQVRQSPGAALSQRVSSALPQLLTPSP